MRGLQKRPVGELRLFADGKSGHHPREVERKVIVPRRSPDAMVLASYERMLTGAPHVVLKGLWAVGEHYYIWCPELSEDTKALDGSPIAHWLHEATNWLAPPIDLVAAVPEGARQVEPRSLREAIELRGVARNLRDMFTDLALRLGPEFPEFKLKDGKEQQTEIHIERKLESEEILALTEAVEELGEPIEFVLLHPSLPDDGLGFYRAPQGDLTLCPARALRDSSPRRVRHLLEDEEEFWMDNRRILFGGEAGAALGQTFPSSWSGKELKCVVDASVFPPANMRTYLTLFDTVFLGLPLGDRHAEQLALLGVTGDELTQLVALGRVKVLLPQPIERYDQKWIAQTLDASPDGIVGSRRIACGVIDDAQTRMPFLYPPLEFDERRLLLNWIHAASQSEELPLPLRKWFEVLRTACQENWDVAALAVQRGGAMETARAGIAWLVTTLHKEFTGQDRVIEIMGASMAVEWAACLGAHVCPSESPSYSSAPAVNLLAAMFSPFADQHVPVADSRERSIAEELLAIDNDVPVVEFAKEFEGADINRFRVEVDRIARWNQDEEFLAEAISRFNAEVRQYERRPNRLRTMNLSGLAAATAAEAAPAFPEPLRHVPLGVWLLGMAISLGGEATKKSGVAGRLWDSANGRLARTTPRSVLLSRLRTRLGIMK